MLDNATARTFYAVKTLSVRASSATSDLAHIFQSGRRLEDLVARQVGCDAEQVISAPHHGRDSTPDNQAAYRKSWFDGRPRRIVTRMDAARDLAGLDIPAHRAVRLEEPAHQRKLTAAVGHEARVSNTHVRGIAGDDAEVTQNAINTFGADLKAFQIDASAEFGGE